MSHPSQGGSNIYNRGITTLAIFVVYHHSSNCVNVNEWADYTLLLMISCYAYRCMASAVMNLVDIHTTGLYNRMHSNF